MIVHYFRPLLTGLLASICFLTSVPASAAAIQVLSAADLQATDVTAGYPGPTGSTYGSPLLVAAGGNTLTFTNALGDFRRFEQGIGFVGNFSAGAPLLNPRSSNTLDIDFAIAVREVGLNIQSGYQVVSSLETLTAYNGERTLGTWSVANRNTGRGDGNAPFLGVRATEGDAITRIRLRNHTDVPEFDYFFAIGPVTFATASAVPEPASSRLIPLAMLGGWWVRRFLKRS